MRNGFTRHHFSRYLKNGAGFTLVETLVVVAITAFLSGILLTYNRSSDNQVVLAAEQARVAGMLFRAKSFALQKNIRRADARACGFGVYFEKQRRLVLFEDLPTSGGDCGTQSEKYEEGEEIEELVLNSRVSFKSFTQGSDKVSVAFDAPYLETHGDGTITLELTATGDKREITVGAGGFISSQ